MMKASYTILKFISDICYWIGSILGTGALFAILLVMLTQVFMRYLMAHPLNWPEVLSKLLFIWAAYLGTGILIRARGHITIDYIITKFPKVAQGILRHIFSFTMLWISIVFTIYSFSIALSTQSHLWELGMISEVWVWLSMPIAGFFIVVHIVFIIYEDIYKRYASSE